MNDNIVCGGRAAAIYTVYECVEYDVMFTCVILKQFAVGRTFVVRVRIRAKTEITVIVVALTHNVYFASEENAEPSPTHPTHLPRPPRLSRKRVVCTCYDNSVVGSRHAVVVGNAILGGRNSKTIRLKK